MRVEAVELLRLDLPLRHALSTSIGEHELRPVLLVVVRAEGGVGYGECEALLEPTYTEEYATGAEAVLAEHLVPRLLAGGPFGSTVEAMERLAPVRGHHMAKAGLEMALLDAELRLADRNLSSELGAKRESIVAGANVSIGDPDLVVRDVKEAVDAGYRRVKVKIAPGRDLEPLLAVRRTFPELVLSADANGSYRYEDDNHHDRLHRLDEVALAALEQPFPPDDLLSHERLAAELSTPIVLDESITSLETLELAMQLEACDAVSVKAARLGGLLVAKEIHDRCVARGIGLSIGGMLESGIGRAAAIALAALPGFTLPGDLGASERYFEPDLCAPHLLDADGRLAVPQGAGLGVQPDLDVIEERLARRTVVTAP